MHTKEHDGACYDAGGLAEAKEKKKKKKDMKVVLVAVMPVLRQVVKL